MSNSLDTDKDQYCVGPNLGPYWQQGKSLAPILYDNVALVMLF